MTLVVEKPTWSIIIPTPQLAREGRVISDMSQDDSAGPWFWPEKGLGSGEIAAGGATRISAANNLGQRGIRAGHCRMAEGRRERLS